MPRPIVGQPLRRFVRGSAGSHHRYTGSGGLTFGGAATTISDHVHSYTGSGGLTFGGSAATLVILNHVYAGSGGLVFGGSAATGTTLDEYDYAGSGGLVFGGAAVTHFAHSYVYAGSGGLTFGGAASTSIQIVTSLVELYPNLAQTRVVGSYVAGSGHLNVTSTALPFKQTGSYRVAISDPSTTSVKVLLRVLAVNSSTQFAVEAEGADASGANNDFVTAVLTEGAMYATRADATGVGNFAGLPDSATASKGDAWHGQDGHSFVFDGLLWQGVGASVAMAKPVQGSFSALNAGSATLSDSGNGLIWTDLAAEAGVHGQEVNAPVTPWTATAKLFGLLEVVASEYPAFGIYVRNNGTGKIETLTVWNNDASGGPGYYVSVDLWDSATTYNSAIFAKKKLLAPGDGVWLRLDDDGSSKHFSMGVDDGVNFHVMLGETRTTNLTADRVGFFLRTDGSAKIVSTVLKSWKIA